MLMWFIILLVIVLFTITEFCYLSKKMNHFQIISLIKFKLLKLNISGGLIVTCVSFLVLCLIFDLINAIVCFFYVSLFWLIFDVIFVLIEFILSRKFKVYYAGIFALVISSLLLCLGWYQAHNVWIEEYTIKTHKNIHDTKITFIADSHIGTTFTGKEFANHVATMQKQAADIIFIVGDFVDDDTSKEDMLAATRALKDLKTTYGVYFVFGNHDEGYYGAEHRGFSAAELITELQKNNVVVLQDTSIAIDDYLYIIGRKDKVETQRGLGRLTMSELTKGIDKNKFSIVLDHQPNDYKAQEQANVDLVLSGHTHGGQIWPLNYIGELIGANDQTYGYKQIGNTNFVVTSGISDWAIKFKTGTRSEIVTIHLEKD
jgi:uncharacterized protein